MYKLYGIAVSTGIGIGRAKIIKEKEMIIEDYKILEHEIESELRHFKSSIDFVIHEIDEFAKNFDVSKEDEAIIETHKMILKDPEFHKSIEKLVKKEMRNLSHAIHLHFTNTIEFFKNLDNELYADRAIDYEDVYKRLLRQLKKIDDSSLAEINSGDIVVMTDIPPSMVAQLQKKKIEGIILYKGTRTSHSVIIARAYGIPIITGMTFKHKIHDDDLLIIDAKKGIAFGNPTQTIINKYKKIKNEIDDKAQELSRYKDFHSTTANAEKLEILSNIELPMGITEVLDVKSDGIGLFRTEFFYLNRQDLPSEKEQFAEYKMIAQKLGKKKCVIRTIDIGGDKVAGWYSPGHEANPYLGCRGIRFSLKYPNIFKTQLLAILRASAFGNIYVMFPMIATVEEFLKAKKILMECQKELAKKKIPFNHNIPVGTMIEIPSAVMCSNALAKHSDFFSIGTNDLLQYTVAVDRNNENIAYAYDPYNPAFLQLVLLTIKNAMNHKIPVAVCGELAADQNFTAFLVNAGVRELSVGVEYALSLKKYLRSVDSQKGVYFLDEINNCSTIKESHDFIKKLNKICTSSAEIIV